LQTLALPEDFTGIAWLAPVDEIFQPGYVGLAPPGRSLLRQPLQTRMRERSRAGVLWEVCGIRADLSKGFHRNLAPV
jgi:hypothetical protein